MPSERYSPIAPRSVDKFCQVYLHTGDAVLAYRAVKTRASMKDAERLGPLWLWKDEIQTEIARRGGAIAKTDPDALTDGDVLRRCKRIIAAPGASDAQVLDAMKVYNTLRRGIAADKAAAGGYGAELAAFLRDEGIPVSLPVAPG